MEGRFSLRFSLDELLKNKKNEKTILENVRYANRLVGKSFKVVFYNTDVKEKDVLKFVKKYENLLFEVNTQITKRSQQERCWFLIESDVYLDKCKFHYKFTGDILNGIAQYIKIIKHINDRKDLE
ncbi:MAG: hypothetical protein CMB78_06270 [Euryarchaeota archaeon]|nr:hypothetical protein [Euryarchaeota archaeon]|tara:strand:+ start:132 stop:506 length:375 start_codon:yes stop_codon:yes gene_type:complete